MKYYIGIMSGTSMDGIDTVLVTFEDSSIQIIKSYTQAFPNDLKTEMYRLLNNYQSSLQKLGEIDHQLAVSYADAVENLLKDTGVALEQVEAIGCHGQTFFHAPVSRFPFTIQLGNGNLLAAKTGIKTIMDFRRMDMAFGGEGAPLAPAFHQAYFSDVQEKRVILNLGGIANITILSEEDDSKVTGFDTGPANCLMDSWIQYIKGEKFDKDGLWATSGKVIPKLLNTMLKDNYFKLPAPKSTGRELFNMNWLNNHLEKIKEYKNEDIQATLLELTAISVSESVKKYAPETNAVYACGGGAFNKQLLNRLSNCLSNIKVSTTGDLGVAPQQVEAVAFAWLAMRRVNNLSGNLPSVTGASRKVLLGTIFDPGTF
nr:anhydro-N-acetylmuramic acid kinase [uncultured Draconibacterium sp.]